MKSKGWIHCTPKRKTDNNFLLKILSRFSAIRLRSVLQIVNTTASNAIVMQLSK